MPQTRVSRRSRWARIMRARLLVLFVLAMDVLDRLVGNRIVGGGLESPALMLGNPVAYIASSKAIRLASGPIETCSRCLAACCFVKQAYPLNRSLLYLTFFATRFVRSIVHRLDAVRFRPRALCGW